jgi:3-deoxy-manno-octulosonate cytidylyltransferase (CMP-KDO synthetase)
MKIIAFIPARYHSSRLPAKPLALITGLPMIQHVYQCALASSGLHAIYVATDDQRIAECVRSFGGQFIMTSPKHASGTDRIAEAAQKLRLQPEDLIVNIQGDQPSFHPSLITAMINPLLADQSLLMSTLKYKIRDQNEINNPHHVKIVTDKEDFALYFSRAPIPFYRDAQGIGSYYKHLGFYAYRLHFLKIFTSLPIGPLEAAEKLEQLRALEHGFNIKVAESAHDSPEVDTPQDISKLEGLIQKPANKPS